MYMIDLFAGCGGATTGFEKSGFESVLVSEINRDALKTYLINRNNKIGEIEFRLQQDLHYEDINELNEKNLEKIRTILGSRTNIDILQANGKDAQLDLVIGGPPCQGYSTIGYRRTYNVERKVISQNSLYQKMINFIENVRPKIFLFENVRGLLTAKWTFNGKKGEIWENVLEGFRSIKGYEVRWSLIESKKFGIPQNRPRVLLVGIRKDCLNSKYINLKSSDDDALECGFIPSVNKKPPHLSELLSDLIDKSIEENLERQCYPENFMTERYLTDPLNDLQKELRTISNLKILEKGSVITEQVYSKHSMKVIERFKYMHENNGKIKEEMKTKKFSQRLLPSHWEEIGPTITATSLPDDYVHYCQPRTLTVRELARIQTFPDSYRFSGPRTTGSVHRAGNPNDPNIIRVIPKYTQIGNAIPVNLANEIGCHFRRILNE